MDAPSATTDRARMLWKAFHDAQHDRAIAWMGFNEAQQSVICDLDIFTPEGVEEARSAMVRASSAYDEALAELEAFYAEQYGENGTTVLTEYLAAATERANVQFDYAHSVAYSHSELVPARNRSAHGAAAAEAEATGIPAAQARLDRAQAALDALTGVRVT